MLPKHKSTPMLGSISFESSALNGLRGFLAVHLATYHSLLFSTLQFDNYGNVSSFSFLSQFLIVSETRDP